MTKLLRFAFVKRKLESLLKICSVYMRKVGMEESSLDQTIFKPPASVRGMLQLDRDAFKKQVDIPAILVPLKSMNTFLKTFKNDTFKNRGAQLVNEGLGNEGSTAGSRFITMKPEFDFKDLHPKKLETLKELDVEETVHQKKMEIRYEHYRHNEILGAILPEGLDSTSGFERVGHIVHVNLHDHQRPYKHIIGQVLIDTHKSVKTVVDKSNAIDNTYRNFEMEVIGGEEDFVAKVVEFGIPYEFDFSKVFWNSRLQTEHRRIYDAILKASTVFDVFAGVGPFSVPLAKKGCEVYANDLNGESYKWLCHNAKLNKTKLDAFNMDGRNFIQDCLGKHLRAKPSTSNTIFVVMNLPGHAIDFLDAFKGLLSSDKIGEKSDSSKDLLGETCTLPAVHIFCYVFSSAEDKLASPSKRSPYKKKSEKDRQAQRQAHLKICDSTTDVRKRAAKSLGEPLPDDHTIREVRKVSPSKEQFCLSFDLRKSVLTTSEKKDDVDSLGPECKRPKMSQSLDVS